MKAKAAVLVVAALAAAGATPPAKVVDENFENPQFPPAGWRIETQFVNASWTRQTDAGNSYALGYCQTGGNEYADASLFTGKLTLAAGNVLKYRCRYAGTKSGNLSTWYREAALMKGTELIWYYRFGESGWADYQTTLPPLVQSGSDYEFRWTFYAHGAGSGQGGNVSFTVDDVVVEIDNAAAAPASLGRVKALFRRKRAARNSNAGRRPRRGRQPKGGTAYEGGDSGGIGGRGAGGRGGARSHRREIRR